jgi:Ca2+/H+ antiporter
MDGRRLRRPVVALLAEDGPEGPDEGVLVYSRVVSVVLFILYLFYLFFQLGTHRHYYESHKSGEDEEELLPRGQRVVDRESAQSLPPRTPPLPLFSQIPDTPPPRCCLTNRPASRESWR